ncbi:MAG: hypothetical protein ACE5FZ_09590 [Nitrospiria bacterium]
MTLRSQQKWWSKLSKREKILCVLTLGAVCYSFLVFSYNPRVAAREKLNSQILDLSEEVTRLGSTLETLREDGPAEQEISPVQDAGFIHSGTMLSKLLHKMYRQARGQRVELLEIKPNVLENKGAYRVLPLDLKTRSRFRDLGLYLLSLERFPEPVVIDRIIIRSDLKISPEVVTELSLHVYRRGEA